MNFADQLTNPGQSLVYVVTLLLSIHLLFNIKIGRRVCGNKIFPVSYMPDSATSYGTARGLKPYTAKRFDVIHNVKDLPHGAEDQVEGIELSKSETNEQLIK